MDWQAPAIVLDARPFGEGDLLVTLLAETEGRRRGLARGGASRTQSGLWLPGNVIAARWVGRLADQLGTFSGELVHPGAALAMEDSLALAILAAACAVADGALPEREPHSRAFAALLRLILDLPQGAPALAELARFELDLLAELGYGLDLASCAVTGERTGLAFVSPKTGRAVSEAAAGSWRSRLLPLPCFLTSDAASGPADWLDGLRLTGHFLARDVFGLQHRSLPSARIALFDRRVADAAAAETAV